MVKEKEKEKKNGKLVEITYRVKCGVEPFAKLGLKILTYHRS